MAGFLKKNPIIFKSKVLKMAKIDQRHLRERAGTVGLTARDPRETSTLRRLHLSLVEITKWW